MRFDFGFKPARPKTDKPWQPASNLKEVLSVTWQAFGLCSCSKASWDTAENLKHGHKRPPKRPMRGQAWATRSARQTNPDGLPRGARNDTRASRPPTRRATRLVIKIAPRSYSWRYLRACLASVPLPVAKIGHHRFKEPSQILV